ncbi:MAG TPA: hypothetical protein VGJ46_07070, partial [Candidatus Limnocylindrales bacterium]
MISRAGRIALGAMILAVTGVLAATTAGPATSGAERPKLRGPSKCIADVPKAPGGGWNFPEFRTLGVRVWVSGISWASIATARPANPRSPTDPAYVWPADLDTALNKARAYGIEPVLYVNGFPAWSNEGKEPNWVSTNPADYGDFTAAAVARYPQVRRWIVLSEPSQRLNFRPQGSGGRLAPRLYARLLSAAYGAMHAVRPDVVVIGGNVGPGGQNDEWTTAPDTFLRNMVLPNGRRPKLDMFGINPYTERPINGGYPRRPGRVDLDDLDWLGRQLDRYYPSRHLQIFIGEFGWITEHEATGWLYVVTWEEQAARLTRAYRMASRLPRINTMCWFQLYDAPPDREGTRWLNWTSGLR